MKSLFTKPSPPICYDLLSSFEMIDEEEITQAINDKIFIENHDLMVGIDGTVMPYSYEGFVTFKPFVIAVQRENFTPEMLKEIPLHFDLECIFEEFGALYYSNQYLPLRKEIKQSLSYPFIEQLIKQWDQQFKGYYFKKAVEILTFNKMAKWFNTDLDNKKATIANWQSLLNQWNMDDIYLKGTMLIKPPLKETLSERQLIGSRIRQIFTQKEMYSPESRDNLYLFLKYPYTSLAIIPDSNSHPLETKKVLGSYAKAHTMINLKNYTVDAGYDFDYYWTHTFLHELNHFAADVGYSYGCGDSPLGNLNDRFTGFLEKKPFFGYVKSKKDTRYIMCAFEKDILSLEIGRLAKLAHNFLENKKQNPNYTFLDADNIESLVNGANIRKVPVKITEDNWHLFSEEVKRVQKIEEGLAKAKFNERYSMSVMNRWGNPQIDEIILILNENKAMTLSVYAEELHSYEIFANIASLGFSDELNSLMFPETYKIIREWQPCINKALEQFTFDTNPIPLLPARLLPDRCLINPGKMYLANAENAALVLWGAYLTYLGVSAFKWIKQKLQQSEPTPSFLEAVVIKELSKKEEKIASKEEIEVIPVNPQEKQNATLYWQNQEQLRRRQTSQSQAIG